jgi:tetratricopeptide (TPR) repeat protein
VTPEARTTAILELERVLEAYPSNGMAAEAAYALGDLRFSGGEHDKARAAWQLAISRSRATTLTTLARAGIGAAWEADKNLPEATQAYETALADLKPTSFYYEELLVDLARVQELSGKKDAATATYRRLLKDLPRSVRADEIRNRLAHLGVTP